MRHIASNLLILPDGSRHEMAVATFDDNGNFVSWHPLLGEEPFVEWHRGTLDLYQDQK